MNLIGFVIADDGAVGSYMAMYGFLHTAEILGYPAKLYRAPDASSAKAAVSEAVADGCKGLLMFSPNGVNDEAVRLAVESGVRVVVPYDACTVEGIDAQIVADTSEYVEEVARGLSVRMTERSLKSGRILVYGRNTADIYTQFVQDVGEYYPQFSVVSFDRTAADEESAIDELAQFILFNRDIKGMYVADSDLASIAVKARTRAKSIFESEGTPSPTLAPVLSPNITAAPTPNPSLLKTITITVFASGLSDENYALFNDSDIYGLCIEPYYEAAAQATMTLDKLLHGDTVPAVSRVNRPIAYADTIDKYLAIQQQVKELFGLS
jgi:ABC-type sugar transport system substrate-binding protein